MRERLGCRFFGYPSSSRWPVLASGVMDRTLKDLRQAARLTQHDLAVAVGALDAQVSGWETGRAKPSLKYIRPLATALSVSTDEVLDAIDASPASSPDKTEQTDS